MTTVLLILVIVLLVLCLGASGYGYHTGGPYYAPAGLLGLVLVVALGVLLFSGHGWGW